VRLKRRRPNWWIRLKSGWKTGLTASGAIFSFFAVVIGLINATEVRVPWKFIGLAAVLSILIFPIAAYLRGRVHLIPDSLIDEMSEDGVYSCEYCSDETLREACEMTEVFYGQDYVAADIALQWWIKNPKAFVAIKNAEGELCACFGILALEHGFMGQFIDGKVSDRQLKESDILSFSASKKANRLYISGVVVRDPGTPRGGKRARVMIWVMLKYIKKLCGANLDRELIALAVTKESENLLKRFGFQLIGNSAQRVDRHNLYSYKLTAETWDKMLVRAYDCSRMCNCEF
jgi:hypothetical protein